MGKLRISASLLLAGLLLAGCGAAAGQAPTTGHLAGRLVREGGPLGPGGQQPAERPMRGTVTVGSSGAFSVPLPPGRYQVSGRSPDIMEVDGARSRELPCSQPTSAAVTAGHTATITLTCVVP